MEKKVLLITTGGTIAGKVASTKKENELIKSSNEFTEVLNDACISIKATQNIDVLLDHFPLVEDIDSSDIMPQHWTDLALKIKESYDNFDAFIVTHGTNTMGYTAAALSFALANLDKPVIITGSQVPAGMPGSDAKTNLENSLRVATLNRRKANVKGVVAVFGSHIITGTKVKKETEFDYDAFVSFGGGSIGRIGRMIDINEDNLLKHLKYLETARFPIALTSKTLICENEFDMRIASLTEFPGMDEKIFETLVRQNNIKAFILRAFGAGDPSTRLLPVLENLKKEKIPIVITTQAPKGNSNFQVNESGQKIAERKLAIPAFDMSIEAMTTKLGWLMAKYNKGISTYEQVCEEMIVDIRGEIKVIHEVTM